MSYVCIIMYVHAYYRRHMSAHTPSLMSATVFLLLLVTWSVQQSFPEAQNCFLFINHLLCVESQQQLEELSVWECVA